MASKRKRRNQKQGVNNKKTAYTKWVANWQRQDSDGNILEILPDNPQNKSEIVKQIKAAQAGTPPAQKNEPKPDNVVDMEDQRRAMRAEGKRQAEEEALASVKKAEELVEAGAVRKPFAEKRSEEAAKHKSISNKMLNIQQLRDHGRRARNGELTCHKSRDNLLSADYMKRKEVFKPIGFAGEQMLIEQRRNSEKQTRWMGHRFSPLDNDLRDTLCEKFASEDQAGPEGSPIEDGAGGYSPYCVGRTPSGKPISMFLEGGKYPPKKPDVEYSTTAENDDDYVSKTTSVLSSAAKNVPTDQWPGWFCKLIHMVDDEPQINEDVVNEFTLAEENKVLRGVASMALDHRNLEHEAALESEWRARQELDWFSLEMDYRLNMGQNQQTLLENEGTQNRKPSYSDLRIKTDELQKAADTCRRYRDEAWKPINRERLKLMRIRHRIRTGDTANFLRPSKAFRLKGELEKHRNTRSRIESMALDKRRNAVFGNDARTRIVKRHCIEHDTELFATWSKRHKRRYDPNHERSILFSTDVTKAQWKLDKRKQKQQQSEQSKRQLAKELANNSIDGKVIAGAVRFWNTTASVLNTELNPKRRKIRRQRKERRLFKQQAKNFGYITDLLAASIRENERQEKAALREQAKRMYGMVH